MDLLLSSLMKRQRNLQALKEWFRIFQLRFITFKQQDHGISWDSIKLLNAMLLPRAMSLLVCGIWPESDSFSDEGNSGTLGRQSLLSVAPWILSVAATTTDRIFIDKGFSVNSFSVNKTKVLLLYGLQASIVCDETSARACISGCLNRSLVMNKIVVCDNDMHGLHL
ncbi:hypothetical protein V6N13_056159 [Hibiscus sabdariffa]